MSFTRGLALCGYYSANAGAKIVPKGKSRPHSLLCLTSTMAEISKQESDGEKSADQIGSLKGRLIMTDPC